MAIRDGEWELDHELSIPTVRYVWKRWDGQQLTVRTDYPVDNIIAANTAERNETSGRHFGEVSKVASIPIGLLNDPKTGLGDAFRQQDLSYLKRWLNDSDNAAFRTHEGNL